MSDLIVKPQQALEFCTEAFMALDVPEADGKIVAANLVEADLRGHASHGVSRLKFYMNKLAGGGFNPKPDFKIVKDKPSILVMDSDNSLGAVAGVKAMSMCIEKAKKTGMASAAVRNSNHFGIAAFYAMMALEHNMIGIATTNTNKLVAVHGGACPMLGTNPIAIAVPAGKRYPLVFDAATSVVASGKMIVADIEGKAIPEGWALDRSGNPTTSPKEALLGVLLPLGGYKGSGLSIMVEVLSAVLSGALTSPHVIQLREVPEKGQGIGFFFSAIDVASFEDLDVFQAGIDQLIDELKACKKMQGVEEILMPGEIEYRNKEKFSQSGLKIGSGVFNDLLQIKERFNLKKNLLD